MCGDILEFEFGGTWGQLRMMAVTLQSSTTTADVQLLMSTG
jgi:hypothetical protein